MNDKSIENKLLLNARIQTATLLCILLLVLGAVVSMASQLSSVRSGMEVINDSLQALDMEEVDQAIASLHDAADQLSRVDMVQFNETARSLKDAAARLEEVDTDSLNKAVTALKGAAENLKDIDVAALNKLVEALEGSAEKLQNAVNAVTGVFRR